MLKERLRSAGAVGLDTAVFVYAFERHPHYGVVARTVFEAIEGGLCAGITSVLALGEVLTGVKRSGDEGLQLRYREVFRHFPGLTMHNMDLAVVELMSDLRARYAIPTPDAIHMGTALAAGATAFVTNDARLRRVQDLETILLSEYVQGNGTA